MLNNSSINDKELLKFSKISDKWWAQDGEFAILHQINPVRLSYILDKLKSHFKIHAQELPFTNLDILDIGCGGGLITEPLSKLGGNITGIDALQSNIDLATNHAAAQDLNINYIKSTVEELPKNVLYDVIVCLEVIEHIDNISNFISNISALVKPGGMIIISTINHNLKSYLLAIIAAEYLLNWVPKKTHDYAKFLKPSEIYALFNKQQMLVREFKGLTFDLPTMQWQLSNNIDVNYFAYLTHASSK